MSPPKLPARVVAALLCLSLLGPAPALAAKSAEPVQLPDLALDTYKLPNGLGVILYEDHSTPIVGINIWYHVGSGSERPGRTGFAHLFEHMMFQGSGHQDGEYIEALQGMGAFVNGSTNEDRTNYLEVVPSSHLEAALLMEADRMGWLLDGMTDEEFATQQKVTRNERRETEGRPYGVFWLAFNEAFYPPGHPYDHSVIGAHEDLANATLEDGQDFFHKYYAPNNATLCIAGDFDPETTKAWIEKYFGPIPPGPPVEKVATWIPEMRHEKRLEFQDRVQLPRLTWCWHTAPRFHDGDADLDLATTILGEGRTSRLYKRLVHEEKLAQSVSFAQESQQISSVAMLTVTLRPDASRADVERIVDEELAKFAARGPTEAELLRAKSGTEAYFVRALQRVGGFGGLNDRLNMYNHYVGTPNWLRQDHERYTSRTRETVREAFNRWIGPGRMLVAVIPYEGGEPVVADVDRTKLPPAGPRDEIHPPDVERAKLANGMEVRLMPQTELPLVQLQLVFRSGSAAEAAEREGLCELASSMHLEGTRKHDKFAFENELELLGADLRVFTNDDRTIFSLECLADRLDASVALLAEALLTPTFPETEFADLKQRRLVDLRRSTDRPEMIARKVTRRVVFGEQHPYSRTGDGTPGTIGAITLDDIRGFSADNFTPGNATLVVVGDVTMDEVRRVIDRHLGDWEGAAPVHAAIPEAAPPRGRIVYLVDKPGDTQSTLSIAQLGLPRNNPAWEPTYVANRILGGNFSSRLNLNIREDKGWTYGVRTILGENAARGLFVASGRVEREFTAPAITEFLGEIEGAAGRRPFTPAELDFAKDSILLGYPREFETVGQLAGALADQVVFHLPDDEFARYPERIDAVDLAAANSAAKGLFHPADMAIVVVGDLAKIEQPVRELNLGEVVRLDRDGRPIEAGGPAAAVSSR